TVRLGPALSHTPRLFIVAGWDVNAAVVASALSASGPYVMIGPRYFRSPRRCDGGSVGTAAGGRGVTSASFGATSEGMPVTDSVNGATGTNGGSGSSCSFGGSGPWRAGCRLPNSPP